MSGAPSIRAATRADAGALTRLINAAYLVEQFFVTGDRVSREDVLDLIERGTLLLAEDAGVPVACVYLEPRGPGAYLGLLSVHPDRQGKGLGSRLLDVAERLLRRAGCASIEIKVVNLRAELPPFYHRRGYVDAGTEPFGDPRATGPCHFILMSKRLRAEAAD